MPAASPPPFTVLELSEYMKHSAEQSIASLQTKLQDSTLAASTKNQIIEELRFFEDALKRVKSGLRPLFLSEECDKKFYSQVHGWQFHPSTVKHIREVVMGEKEGNLTPARQLLEKLHQYRNAKKFEVEVEARKAEHEAERPLLEIELKRLKRAPKKNKLEIERLERKLKPSNYIKYADNLKALISYTLLDWFFTDDSKAFRQLAEAMETKMDKPKPSDTTIRKRFLLETIRDLTSHKDGSQGWFASRAWLKARVEGLSSEHAGEEWQFGKGDFAKLFKSIGLDWWPR